MSMKLQTANYNTASSLSVTLSSKLLYRPHENLLIVAFLILTKTAGISLSSS